MGPAPMIRMVEMSVLLGIRSRGLGFGHKKRARMLRVPRAVAPGYPQRAGWSLDQIPHPRNPQKCPINRQFQPVFAASISPARRLRNKSSASATETLEPPIQPRSVGPRTDSTRPPAAPPMAKPKYIAELLSDSAIAAACGSIRMMLATCAG